MVQVLPAQEITLLELSETLYPLLEPVVKMVVLSPLLRLAGFYRPPFYIAAFFAHPRKPIAIGRRIPASDRTQKTCSSFAQRYSRAICKIR